MTGLALDLIVKLLPTTRAPILYTRPVVALQVIPSRVPSDESSVINIWLSPVTAAVFTKRVVPPAAIATLPDGAEPHVAGDAVELQFVTVTAFPKEIVPGMVVVIADLPMVMEVALIVPKLSAPFVIVSINEPICINRFPEVRVMLEPSSENRESPIVLVVTNFASLFVVPELIPKGYCNPTPLL